MAEHGLLGVRRIGPEARRGGVGVRYRIEMLYHGLALGLGDSGIAAIGRIDRARIPPGHVIAMHPHRDDEILTYIRSGGMRH